MFVFFPDGKMDFTFQKYKLTGVLENVESLEDSFATLHEIKKVEDFINRSHEALQTDGEIS